MTELTFPVAGGTLRGHLARPTGDGPWPGVVVLHEVFGLTDDIKRQADRFAEHGYLALAPDLYAWGNTARCLMATLRTMFRGDGRALDDINGARTLLTDRDDCTGSVGVIGFCMGGGLALLVAPTGFAAAAPNYGDLPRRPEEQLRGACPVVGSYGYRDRRLRGTAQKLDAVLTTLDVEHDVTEYPTAKHGFLFEHTGKTSWTQPMMVDYDPAAADDAWRRIFAFFDKHVKETTS
ncbi:MAG TPA: dienelactone hydrolase family protein [Mycobacteriales bacterium]|nr:dienelactone hydrolase family protein [Mycobacteriales bacterium]